MFFKTPNFDPRYERCAQRIDVDGVKCSDVGAKLLPSRSIYSYAIRRHDQIL